MKRLGVGKVRNRAPRVNDPRSSSRPTQAWTADVEREGEAMGARPWLSVSVAQIRDREKPLATEPIPKARCLYRPGTPTCPKCRFQVAMHWIPWAPLGCWIFPGPRPHPGPRKRVCAARSGRTLGAPGRKARTSILARVSPVRPRWHRSRLSPTEVWCRPVGLLRLTCTHFHGPPTVRILALGKGPKS